MRQYYPRKQSSISLAVLLCIGIVTLFSFTVRMVGDFLPSTATHQVRRTSFLGGTIAEAVSLGKASVEKKTFDAKKIILSDRELYLAPFEKRTFEIGYKNTGTISWRQGVTNGSSLTLRSSAKAESYFYDPSWKSGNIVRVFGKEEDAQPGEVVFFRFILEAPKKAGSYTERFSLYQGKKKLPSSDVLLPIEVRGISLARRVEEPRHSDVVLASMGQQQFLQAQKLIQSHFSLSLESGSTTVFEVGYKNTGKRAWRVDDMPKVTLRIKSQGGTSQFLDQSWYQSVIPAALSVDTLPGEIAYFRFLIHAPPHAGIYRADFFLSYGEEPILGSDFSLPIEVIGSPTSSQIVPRPQEATPVDMQIPSLSPPPASDTILALAPSLSTQTPSIIDDKVEQEQKIRIGYFFTKDPVRITSSSPYEIRDAQNILLATEQAGAISTVTFDMGAKTYTIQTSAGIQTLQTHPRFTGVLTSGGDSFDPNTIFEIVSYSNRPAWSSSINDNTVRGAVEVRYSEKSEKIWVINELPLEYYLRGLAETSNNSPYEFQKALLIAARTYAKYHIDHSTKYAGEYFTIRSTDHDQVYRGYGAESRLPNVTRAVNETRGVIVYYQGSLAITPYYSQSDGRTRSWEEVWAGTPKPWLVSKDDPPGRGLPLLGHGVGMPARGAISLALEGNTFENILKYYYTGVELRRRY
ncbi:SpoIID/LytB domain-containing protein [Candidatus Uhrbacteria bacterium]|nr:SpoIID/LytB domain-containing protein [Candidatus Uhrbacteria bacterium]